MFGFRFWPYLPRIWVSPQEATPGFNVNEDDVPQSAAAMEIPSSSTSPPPEREFMIETGPLAELPGFRLYPQLDISGFNVGADSLPSQSTVQPDAALDGALPTPKRALVAQSAPRWGLPGLAFKLNRMPLASMSGATMKRWHSILTSATTISKNPLGPKHMSTCRRTYISRQRSMVRLFR